MILFLEDHEAAGKKDAYPLRKTLVNDLSIKSIISYVYKSHWGIERKKIVLLIEKTVNDRVHIINGVTNA